MKNVFLLAISLLLMSVTVALAAVPCAKNIRAARSVLSSVKDVNLESYISSATNRSCRNLNLRLNSMNRFLDQRYSCGDRHAAFIGKVSYTVFDMFELGTRTLNENCAVFYGKWCSSCNYSYNPVKYKRICSNCTTVR